MTGAPSSITAQRINHLTLIIAVVFLCLDVGQNIWETQSSWLALRWKQYTAQTLHNKIL